MGNQQIQVLLVDDHAMVRKGIKALLTEYDDIAVIGEAGNGAAAVELAQQLKPDVILMDLAMPGMDGIEATKRIMTSQPEQRIIVLTSYSGDDKLFPAIKAGALGYLVKDAQPEELVESIRNVYAGEPSLNPTIAWKMLRGMSGAKTPTKRSPEELSEREIEVLRLLTQGKTDQEIAKQLVLTEVTIRTHISRILSKLGLKNRVQAALYGIRTGVVSLEETSDLHEDVD
ncbi:MAG TPA: response regulator transcription factor [Anaerolineales bacterium]|nr:response regulator transcription factor [Anaerolineales bacterium]